MFVKLIDKYLVVDVEDITRKFYYRIQILGILLRMLYGKVGVDIDCFNSNCFNNQKVTGTNIV